MQNFKEYMVSAFQEAGLTDEQVTAVIDKLAAHEKLSPKLNALVKTATEDYNAQLGRVKAAEGKVAQYDTWYKEQALPEYQRVVDELNALKAAGNGHELPPFDASKYVTHDDLVKTLTTHLTEQGGRTAGVMKDISHITAHHVINFGEEPDLSAIEETAAQISREKGIPIGQVSLTTAYEKWAEPKAKEKAKLAAEEDKKKLREEIEKDVRSKYRLPVDQVVPEMSPLFSPRPKEAPQDLTAELVDVWNSGGKK